MKEQHFSSSSLKLDRNSLEVAGVSFLENGPYSFSLKGGECLGLSGRSGVGKTQLLRAIADLVPFEGTIRLHGVLSEDIPAPQWRRLIGMVPADPCWWYDLVGLHFSACQTTGFLESTLEEFGFGKDALTWQVSRLSTGEKQRLALIRALILRPDVLLVDEPTAGLDSYYTNKVETLIATLRKSAGIIVVWVSHDQEQLKRVSTRILRVEKSELLPFELSV
jgi:ABC-type multidrug transport system ATPase subunit